jgi:hypothetical protein
MVGKKNAVKKANTTFLPSALLIPYFKTKISGIPFSYYQDLFEFLLGLSVQRSRTCSTNSWSDCLMNIKQTMNGNEMRERIKSNVTMQNSKHTNCLLHARLFLLCDEIDILVKLDRVEMLCKHLTLPCNIKGSKDVVNEKSNADEKLSRQGSSFNVMQTFFRLVDRQEYF